MGVRFYLVFTSSSISTISTTNRGALKLLTFTLSVLILFMWIFLDVLMDPNKSASSLYNPRGVCTHFLPVLFVLIETKFLMFGEKEVCTKEVRRRFQIYMMSYIGSYVGYSCIYYQLAGLQSTGMGGEKKDYSYNIFQFGTGKQVGLSIGLCIGVSIVAMLLGLAFERVVLISRKEVRQGKRSTADVLGHDTDSMDSGFGGEGAEEQELEALKAIDSVL